ncbi:hypothetical protein XA68_15858 [Ophiocordyceps unilateralis]|uniref:Box C/D snoRNA protein 1 n=1 Tax=Ophiocordyceps unilateralis TaxID=268505 RepID=A0A2A9P780_OPHUN|nr:hypothetical protein XA68_15858 [Ophiocordyceps unilateralis]
MADPLLTTLCSICHAADPKYKCPRCRQRTCSVACVKKHKAWSACNGERDETAYVPASKLRTVSGLNHDYNYLHKMDLSMERAERLLVTEKGLISQQELRPRTVKQVRWKAGRDGRKIKVVTIKTVREPVVRTKSERLLAGKMRRLNIDLVRAPKGMTRQKENHTSVNRRSGAVNWQVEWLSLGDDGEGAGTHAPMTRVLLKVLEHVPLYRAYQSVLQHTAGGTARKAQNSGRLEGGQGLSDSVWSRNNPTTIQEPSTGCWVPLYGADVGPAWPHEVDEAQRRQFRFFLGGPPSGSAAKTTVTAVAPEDCLREVLPGTTVVEFPTLYVLRADQTLPASLVLLKPRDTKRGQKRERGSGADGWPVKRPKHDDDDGGSEDEELVMGEGGRDATDEEGSDEAAVDVEELSEGEIWEVEEDEDEDEDRSTTSSSGSDSDSD